MSGEEAFLGITRSITGRAWNARVDNPRLARAIAERYGLPEALARVLAGREVPVDAVETYLNPTLRSLMPDPHALAGMEAGSHALAEAIATGRRIAIIGDYDVDGVTSTALLVRFLRAFGIEPLIHIPDRIDEGYGPSLEAVERLKSNGAELLITVDCGITAFDPLARAAELGLDVIIVDHHQADEDLPVARAVINPNRHDDISGQGHLAAVGVVMMLLVAVARALRARGGQVGEPPDLLQWLDLVALGTICDVVPLTGLNRAFVMQGLKIMARRTHPGLAALADIARLQRRPDAHALGFVLGPRINAAGRLGRSMLGLQLLTSDDPGEAARLAGELETLNRQRQDIEVKAFEAAEIAASLQLERDPNRTLILVAAPDWHVGVLGLIASRLRERFSRPAIAVGIDARGGLAMGSGRSVPGVDLGGAIRAALAAGLLVKGGGHAMAAGLTVEAKGIERLSDFLVQAVAAQASASLSRPSLTLDGALSAGAASVELIELLERAGPFGSGNPAPVFALPAQQVRYAELAGRDHVRCTLRSGDGSSIKAIAFRALGAPLGELLLSERNRPVHVAGRLILNDWGGRRSPQLMIDDAAAVG